MAKLKISQGNIEEAKEVILDAEQYSKVGYEKMVERCGEHLREN